MGKIQLSQLEKADTLPFRLSSFKASSSDSCDSRYRHYYHPENNPYKIADYILNNNIGKSFDLAFHYYCTKIKNKYERKAFLDNFNNNSYRYRHKQFYLDENNLIQKVNNKTKKEVILYTSDYKVEKLHKETKHNFDLFGCKYSKKIITSNRINGIIREYKENDKFLGYYYKNHKYLAQDSDFEYVITSGKEFIFSSKNDYLYQRIINERIKAKNKQIRVEKKIKKSIDYNSLIKKFTNLCYTNLAERKRKQIEQIKLEKDLNEQTIVRLGFDVKTSFRNN